MPKQSMGKFHTTTVEKRTAQPHPETIAVTAAITRVRTATPATMETPVIPIQETAEITVEAPTMAVETITLGTTVEVPITETLVIVVQHRGYQVMKTPKQMRTMEF